MRVWTARVGYKGKPGQLVLDTTVLSGCDQGQHFAPYWGMVNAYKAGRMGWAEYTKRYTALMRVRFATDREAFLRVCRQPEVVLLCYCPAGDDCHRVLLADILVKTARHELRIEAEYMGEANEATTAAPTNHRLFD